MKFSMQKLTHKTPWKSKHVNVVYGDGGDKLTGCNRARGIKWVRCLHLHSVCSLFLSILHF